VVVIIDNAKYPTSQPSPRLASRTNPHFHLDYLPPYSPDLNLIERVWEPDIAVVEAQFVQWTQGNEKLRRLCSI
jgi:hypothetical protein